MGFWDGIAPSPSNLRLFAPANGWRSYTDQVDGDGKVTFAGSHRDLDQALGAAVNASHLIVLTGSGSSFCATNPGSKQGAPGMRDLWGAVEAAVTSGVMKEVIDLIPGAKSLDHNIEKLLTLCKMYLAVFEGSDTSKVVEFIKGAEKAILARVDFVDEATNISSHRTLVRKIARRGIRKPRAKIFTTNYDLCFEYAAREQQFVVIDGFSHSTPQAYDRAHFGYDIVRREGAASSTDYIENVFHLYKLHGSIDWRRDKGRIIRSRDASIGTPVLVYPRDTKYQEAFEAPYLDMMGALQAALREPDTALIISGYGFNDDHISKPIMAALEANMSLRLIICDVAFLDDTSLTAGGDLLPANSAPRNKNSYLARLKDLVGLGDQRITLMNGRFDDLALAIPDLVAQTERERHQERMATGRTVT